MTYEQALKFISSKARFKSEPSLEGISRLTSLCGNPQGDLRFIHVAGTNGKGSVCCMLANILEDAGYKTGLFISPYVIEFTERIQVNGQYIGHSEFAEIITQMESHVSRLANEGVAITEFEIITAAALIYFRNQHCDYVVFETGLGGRYDATNVISPPEISIITHIDLDHTQILGNTYAEIAAEKCGIIKKGTKAVVSYPQQHRSAKRIIQNTCACKGVQLFCPQPVKEGAGKFTLNHISMVVSMPGEHQVDNAATAAQASLCLGIDRDYIVSGIKRTKVPARMEIIRQDPVVMLDGSHNPDGIHALVNWVKSACDSAPVVIIGMLKDKNVHAALSCLCPHVRAVIAVSVSSARSFTAEELSTVLRQYHSRVYTVECYDDALALSNQLSQGAPIIICGSLYLASDIRQKAIEYFQK